jgi:hypothetical protein
MLGAGQEVPMRQITRTLVLLSFVAASAGAAQKPPETEKAKAPVKGDKVVVRGCLSGTMLHADETRRNHDSGWQESLVTFRLTGPRNLLRTLRDEHEHEIVDVSGVLKSELPDTHSVPRGREIGKTRVFVGIGQPPRGSTPGAMVPYFPVLEVASFERAGGRCTPR